MSTPLDNLGFETVKQLRKSLLITATIGIAVSLMIYYSKKDISFFGFIFEHDKAYIITKFIGCIIAYFLVSFIVKFWHGELPKLYQKKVEVVLDDFYGPNLDLSEENFAEQVRYQVKRAMHNNFRLNIISMKTLDIIFPILLGVCSVILCFWGKPLYDLL
jgi:phosphate/sulfate permease